MKELLERLKGREWYHQRFDGSPMYLTMVGEAEVRKEERKPTGTEAEWRICFFDNGKADWFLDMADVKRGAEIITKLAEESPTISEELMANWKEDEEKFQNYFDQFKSSVLHNLTDEELQAEFQTYYALGINRFTSSAVIDHFALGTDQQIADSLREEAGPFANESQFNQVFSTATAPVHQSFINQAEIDLLSIAVQVQDGADINSPEVLKQLEDHQKKYFWTANNYVKAQILSTDYFKEEVNAWLKSGKNLAEELEKLETTPERSKAQKEAWLAEHQLSEHLLRLLKVSENFTHWQDERKKASYLSIHLGSSILAEMAKRKGIDAELTKYLLPEEVKDWYASDTLSAAELENRQKKSVIILKAGGGVVYTGADVDTIHEEMFASMQHEEVQDLRGLVACTGRAVGKVKKLMSAEEVGKVEEGDILVAVMTRPDYVPAMKKAAAIVTDEGGITSHAAIVSRELGVPCIIGTKVATKIFQDNDLVEVNANHNWIRKITAE